MEKDSILELTVEMAEDGEQAASGETADSGVTTGKVIPPMVVPLPMARISALPEPQKDSAAAVVELQEASGEGADEPFELAEDYVVEEGTSIPPPTDIPVDHAFDFGTPAMVFDEEIPTGEGGDGVGSDYDVEVAETVDEMDTAVDLDDDETLLHRDIPPVSVSAIPIPDGAIVTTGPQEIVEEEESAATETMEEEPEWAPEEEKDDAAEVGVEFEEELEMEEVQQRDSDVELEEEEIEIQEIEEVPAIPPVPRPQSDIGPGGRPVDSFFKDDRVAAAQAALKLEAKLQKGKPRGRKEWWATIFDDEYLMLLPPCSPYETQKQIDYIQKTLSLPAGSLVLDLACGNGPNAIGLAQRNFRVVGVDLSLSMLARAGDAAQEAGVKINFIHGDMRDLGFDRTFDGVMCMDTSFGYFDDQTNLKVLNGIFRALKPGGKFLLELSNRDFVIRQQPNMVWFQMDNMVCMEETDFNYINNRLYISRQLIIGDNERQTKHEFSLRLYSVNEIGHMLHEAGFAVLKLSGHRATPGAFFGPESAKILIVAERRRE